MNAVHVHEWVTEPGAVWSWCSGCPAARHATYCRTKPCMCGLAAEFAMARQALTRPGCEAGRATSGACTVPDVASRKASR